MPRCAHLVPGLCQVTQNGARPPLLITLCSQPAHPAFNFVWGPRAGIIGFQISELALGFGTLLLGELNWELRTGTRGNRARRTIATALQEEE